MSDVKYKIRGVENTKIRKGRSNSFIGILILSLILIAFAYMIYGNKSKIKLPSIEMENVDKTQKDKSIQNNNKENITENGESNNKEIKSSDNNAVNNNTMEFYALQYGVFKSEDNAKKLLDSLKNNISAFIVKEGDTFKVISGVYLSSSINEIMDKNKSMGIEFSRVKLSVDLQEDAMHEIAKITDGSLKILNKFNDEKVKSINTDDLKKWMGKLNEDKEINKSPNHDILVELKSYINNLPKEINRDNINENYKYIYTFLKKI